MKNNRNHSIIPLVDGFIKRYLFTGFILICHRFSLLRFRAILDNGLGICEVCALGQIWANSSKLHILLLSDCGSTEAKRRVRLDGENLYVLMEIPPLLEKLD